MGGMHKLEERKGIAGDGWRSVRREGEEEEWLKKLKELRRKGERVEVQRSSKRLSLLEGVVDTLFPDDPNKHLHQPSLSLEEGEWREEWGVSEEELSRALR